MLYPAPLAAAAAALPLWRPRGRWIECLLPSLLGCCCCCCLVFHEYLFFAAAPYALICVILRLPRPGKINVLPSQAARCWCWLWWPRHNILGPLLPYYHCCCYAVYSLNPTNFWCKCFYLISFCIYIMIWCTHPHYKIVISCCVHHFTLSIGLPLSQYTYKSYIYH